MRMPTGTCRRDKVIPASVELLNDYYTQVEPAYTPKTIKDIYSFDSSNAKDPPDVRRDQAGRRDA